MLFNVKKLSVRRRLFVFTLALLLTCTVVLVNQTNVINCDMQMTSWNFNLNKNSPNDSKFSIRQLKTLIESFNVEQKIINKDLFDPLKNNSIVIVVQVHKRITYLRHLIVSLAQARDISQTLLIFSHDFYDEEINELVQSIDFCKVMQIFYPFSIQMHPNEFPGTDPKDCKRDVKGNQALVTNCQNAQFPDLYGHYREASFTQMKHHWWWKLNRIFDQLKVTRNHAGMLLLLEDDYYVSPDFLHVLGKLKTTSEQFCPYCNIMSLGSYADVLNLDNYYKVEVSPWLTSKHNMGMAFDKTTWNDMKSCAKHFCDYDDYNYDWSLQNVNYQCLKSKLHAIISQGPRIFHIGECGVHHNSKNCDSSQIVSKVQAVIEKAAIAGQLFPKYLKVAKIYEEDDFVDIIKANGGWSDLRDIILCLNMTLDLR